MPIVENPDGTLWIDIDEISEVDAMYKQLAELGGRVTALVPDSTCGVTVEEVESTDLYPKIVPRNGPEPGIVVQPAEIPDDHTLLLAVHTMAGAPHGHEVVMVLSLIRGPAPPCFGKISPRRRPPSDPRLRPARPPPPGPRNPSTSDPGRVGPCGARVELSRCDDGARSAMTKRSLRFRPPAAVAVATAQSVRSRSWRHSAATDLDARPLRRNDWALRVDAQTHVIAEIARLRVSIDREAAAVDKTLNDNRSTPDDDYPRWGWVEHGELSRQLAALHEHVARAPIRSPDQLDLRAEFATLLCLAKTLRADAKTWRTASEDGLKELAREEAAAREEQERLAAERETRLRRRDALQFTIDETAGRIAQANDGDCRKTLPVFRLGEALTVCSVTVLSPRKAFRSQPHWLVTLNGSRDQVRVRRSY